MQPRIFVFGAEGVKAINANPALKEQWQLMILSYCKLSYQIPPPKNVFCVGLSLTDALSFFMAMHKMGFTGNVLSLWKELLGVLPPIEKNSV